MRAFQITSKAGVVFGVYEGDTPEAAFSAMVDDAGGPATDCDGNPVEGTAADWIIEEVPGPLFRFEWSGAAGDPPPIVRGLSYATEANGFDADDRAALDRLQIGERHEFGDAAGCSATRVA